MRKVACLAVFMALMMLVPVQAGGDYSVQQSNPADDPKQPSEENKSLYMYYNESNSKAWTHFANQDNESLETYNEEVDDGTINIDLRFRMDPILAKRIYMDPDGLFRGSFDILVEGDWTNGDNQGACDQNQCEELNITLMAGPNEIDTHHETGLTQGQNTVVFNFGIDETTPIDWDGSDFNPEIQVTMKLAGNYQPGFLFPPSGDPAKFEMSMGEMSKIEIPIDDASFTDEFQDGGDIDGGSGSEDTPGFSLVVASAAIAMAVFVNARREEE
ncbi:MAG: hypothetical protein ACPH13_04780 [Candidatus Poseidoniaceae archaeon]